MKSKSRRIESLEERVSELEVLLSELDGRLDEVRRQREETGISTARLLDEWINGRESEETNE